MRPLPTNSFLTRMFDTLEHEGIRYCLMRDADRIEQLARGGEIDLLVEGNQLRDLKRVLWSLGFIRLATRGYEPHQFFVCYDPDSNAWCKLDVVSEIGFALSGAYKRTALAQNCLRNRRRLGHAYAPAAEDEIVCLLLHCVLDKRHVAPHRGRWLRALRHEVRDTSYLSELLAACWLPDADWDELARNIETENWPALLAQRKAVEHHLAGTGQVFTRATVMEKCSVSQPGYPHSC